MAAITVRAKAHTAAPIWATSYLLFTHLDVDGLIKDTFYSLTLPIRAMIVTCVTKIQQIKTK